MVFQVEVQAHSISITWGCVRNTDSWVSRPPESESDSNVNLIPMVNSEHPGTPANECDLIGKEGLC